MKKILALILFPAFLAAFDANLNKLKETKDKVDKTTDQSLAELSKKLKNVQNEKGPIVFKTGKADIEVAKCKDTLTAIALLIKGSVGSLVQIEGHTDNVGSAKVNKTLSQKRAEAVVQYLIKSEKISAKRLKAKGFGDSKPIADNKTKEGREKNRRVDFSVFKQ